MEDGRGRDELVLLQLGARIAEEKRLAEEMEEVRQELYLEEEAERERHRQLAELEKRQRQREELQRQQEEMKIERQLRMQAEREQEEAYRQQVGMLTIGIITTGTHADNMYYYDR